MKDLQAQQGLVSVAGLNAAAKQVGQSESANASVSTSSKQDQELVQLYLNSLVREQNRVRDAIAELEGLKQQYEDQSKVARVDISELNMLTLEISQKDTVTRELVDRLGKLAVLPGNFTSTKVRVIDPPRTGEQVEPRLTTYLPLGGLLGAMLGFGLLLLVGWWDDRSAHRREELQDKLGVPVVARTPRLTSTK